MVRHVPPAVLAAFASAALLASSCGSGNPAGGTEGGPCFPNGMCLNPLVCLSHTCVYIPGPDDGDDDAAADATTDPGGTDRDVRDAGDTAADLPGDVPGADRPGGDGGTGDAAGDIGDDPSADAPESDATGPIDAPADPAPADADDLAGTDLAGTDLPGPPDPGPDAPAKDGVTPPDPGPDACQPIPYFYTACCGDDRCWYDSCGTPGTLYQACPLSCDNDECTSQPGTGLTGAPCEDGGDCITGYCLTEAALQSLKPTLVLPGGMCTQIYCSSNAACGTGGVCADGAGVYPTFPTMCLQSCSADTDCKRLDWVCADIGLQDVADAPAAGCMPRTDAQILLCETDRCTTGPGHRLCPAACP